MQGLQGKSSIYLISSVKCLDLHFTHKRRVYTSAISSDSPEELVHLSGFKVEVLPVRCLGLPWVSGRLTGKDCKQELLVHVRSTSSGRDKQ